MIIQKRMISVRKYLFVFNTKMTCHVDIYLAVFIMFFFLPGVQVNAQGKVKSDSIYISENAQSKLELGIEYLYPTRFSNQIQTITIDGFYWKKHFKDIRMIVSAGLTASYAWGYSTQWEPSGDTIFIASDYKTSAFGIGPVLQISPTIIKTKRFSVIAEANGGILLYNRKFPYGGDVYNLMFRTGPSVAYRLENGHLMKIGCRWMHVSNGKGYGNQNPFYEAIGISLSVLFEK